MEKLSRSPLRSKTAGKKKRGAILFLAVGAILVLSILAIGATSSVLAELRLARFVTDSNLSFYPAFSVVQAMKTVFLNDTSPMNVTLYDLRSREMPFDDKTVYADFSDEESRINIDDVPKDVLTRLPGLEGQSALVDKIYAANILVKEEVLLIDGMTQDIYDQFKGLVTTFGGGVNINTASREVFSILGMDSNLISKIEDFRNGDDGGVGTDDDQYFSGTQEITALLEPYGLTSAQKAFLEILVSSNQLATTSDYIDFDMVLRRTGTSEGDGSVAGKKLSSFNAVVNLTTGIIVSWYEE